MALSDEMIDPPLLDLAVRKSYRDEKGENQSKQNQTVCIYIIYITLL